MSKFHFYRSSGGIGQILIGGLILVGLFIGLFWLARGIFTLLTYVAPFMLIAAAVINYRVVTGYALWIWKTLNRDIFMGVIYVALSIFGFPILAAYLLFKALASRRLKQMSEDPRFNPTSRRAFDAPVEDAEFEIIDEEPLDLNDEEEVKKYERLFDNK